MAKYKLMCDFVTSLHCVAFAQSVWHHLELLYLTCLTCTTTTSPLPCIQLNTSLCAFIH